MMSSINLFDIKYNYTSHSARNMKGKFVKQCASFINEGIQYLQYFGNLLWAWVAYFRFWFLQ